MATATVVAAVWLLAALVTLPVAVVADRRARAERVPSRRRAVAFALTLLAAPLGAGLWLGVLLGSPHRRGPRREAG